MANWIENNTHRVLYRHTPEGVTPPSVNLHSPVSEFVGLRGAVLQFYLYFKISEIQIPIQKFQTRYTKTKFMYEVLIRSSNTKFKYEVQIRNFKYLRKRHVEGSKAKRRGYIQEVISNNQENNK